MKNNYIKELNKVTYRQYLPSLSNKELARIIAEGGTPWCNDEGAPFSCERNCQACIERWLEEGREEKSWPHYLRQLVDCTRKRVNHTRVCAYPN